MNGANALVIMMAKMAPREVLIQKMEQAIKDYNEGVLLNKSKEEMDELWSELIIPALLILTKSVDKDPLDIMRDMEKMDAAVKLLNPNKD